ncbi:MAG: carotenoid oxygenase family protein, partial [Pseudomonadota bacterium]
MAPRSLTRRQFAKGLAGLGAAALLPPSLALGRGSERAAWAVGYAGVTRDLAPVPLKVHGRFPDACCGRLLRNGPALFERAGQRYTHWFDPDGMIQEFTIGSDGISHRGHFVRTAKFEREEAAGRFLFNGAGSRIEGSIPGRNNDTINVANTSVYPFNGELLALWEGGSAHRLDTTTLETLGKAVWDEDLAGVPFSAHPRFDANGDLWNFGSLPVHGSSALVLYHIGADGRLRNRAVFQQDHGGYQHDFVLTPDYLLFLNSSAVAHEGESFVDQFRWEADRPSQLLVFDKQDLSLVKTIEVPAAFVFHFGNAWQQGSDLFFTAAQYADAAFMKHGMARLAQQKVGPYHDETRLLRYRVDLAAGRVTIDPLMSGVEFPGFDRRFPFAAQPLLGVCDSLLRPDSVQSGIVQVDPESGDRQVYDYGADVIVEEPLLIPDDSGRPGSGYVLHSYLDFRRERSGVAVLQSGALNDGPIATAEMDRVL